MNEKNLSSSQVNKYGLYLMTSSLAAMVQMTYVTIFMTDTLQIPTALVASTLLIARIIDFFIGVVCGAIIEKFRMPWGKYRSWLLVFRWVIIFSLVCTFFDTSAWPMTFRVGISFIGYFLMNGGMSLTTNAYYALGPALAGANLNDRNRLSARGAQFMCIAMLIVSAFTIPLVTYLSPIVGSGNSYLIVSILFALPYIWGCQIVSNMCKECDPDGKAGEGQSGPTITLKDMVDSVIQNPQLLVLFMAYTIYYIGLYVISGLGTYYFTYIVGDFMKMAYSATIIMVVGTAASLIMPKFGGKLGKKRAFVVALIVYSLSYVAIYFVGSISWILYTIFGAIGGSAIYLFSTFGANYFVDCGEYHLHKTGKDTRMIAITMYSVPMKIGMAIGGAIAVYGLAFIGYEYGIEINATFCQNFMVLLGIVPAVLVFIGVLIMQFGYKITDEDAARYARENAERMSQNQS